MAFTQSDLAGLSRLVFRAPSWHTGLGFALFVAAMAGTDTLDPGDLIGSWRSIFSIGRDAQEGTFFIGIPTVVTAFSTTGVDRFIDGKLTRNRSSLLVLASEVIIATFLAGAAIVSVLTGLDQALIFNALVTALVSVFVFRPLIVMAVPRSSLLIAVALANIQALTSTTLLFVYGDILRFFEIGGPILDTCLMPYLARPGRAPPELSAIALNHFQPLTIICVMYTLGVYVFLHIVDRPWRRDLDVSVLDFIHGFIGHTAKGTHELEGFFEQLGQEAIIPVTVFSFERDDGTEKVRFVLPMIHPGPMGEIGGGSFPERVARRAERSVFPPHATAGHNFNLVAEREVDVVLDAVDDAYERIRCSPDVTESVCVQSGDAKVLDQRFGGDALLVSTYAPQFADDVEYAVGLSASAETRTTGLRDMLFVDTCNCSNGLQGPDLGHVTPGNKRSFDMITAAELADEELSASSRGSLSLGTAFDPTDWTPREGIGPLGVRVTVTTVGDQATTYVLIDGNNMEPGLRDRIVEGLTTGPNTKVDVTEMMTTDTYIVSTVGAENQVGVVIDHDELRETIGRLVDKALTNTEPVITGVVTERAEVTIFDNNRIEALASHTNVVVSVGETLALALILTAMAVSLLVFFLA